MRICAKCRKSEPVVEFTPKGTYCRLCQAAYAKEWARKNPEHCRETDKRYRQKCRDKIKKYYKGWYAKNGRMRASNYTAITREWHRTHPDAISAHRQIHRAVKLGKLARPAYCTQCGEKGRIEAHHEDYKRPLDVTWLCVSCHKRHHNAT